MNNYWRIFNIKSHVFLQLEIQNATLAGGVSIGMSCSYNVNPWVPVLIGGLAGMLSSVGYGKIAEFLEASFFDQLQHLSEDPSDCICISKMALICMQLQIKGHTFEVISDCERFHLQNHLKLFNRT